MDLEGAVNSDFIENVRTSTLKLEKRQLNVANPQSSFQRNRCIQNLTIANIFIYR